MSKTRFIDSIKVGSVCSESWEEMEGNERFRFCSHCSKKVNDLSAMTRKEAARLVRDADGKLCVRYVYDPVAQRPIFADQLLQITRRTPGIAAGLVTASIALSSNAFAQSSEPGQTPVAIERSIEKDTSVIRSKLKGTITDPNGAVIPNSEVTAIDAEGHSFTVRTDENGSYTFANLALGLYRIQISAAGFQNAESMTSVVDGVDSTVDVPLAVGLQQVSVDVIDALPKGEQFVTMGVMASNTAYYYENPLTRAIAKDDVDAARELIIYGYNVNLKEKELDKGTPLFLAVNNGNAEMAELLLSFRARVNARNASKQTPLMQLDYDATPEMVKVLRRYGAKPNLVDVDGNTALMHAAAAANPEVLQALIDDGADVNVANKAGDTALMIAAENGDVERVRVLVLAGAEVNARNGSGGSALDRASEDAIRSLLISFGAQPTPQAN